VLVLRAFGIDDPAVLLALVVLSVSPVPPILPNKQLTVSRDESYVHGLLAIEGALAIGLVPLSLYLLGLALGRDVRVPPSAVAAVVLRTVFLPLLVGMVVRALAGERAARFSALASRVATALVAVGALVLIVAARQAMWALVGDGTLLAIVVIALGGLAIGHALGGPEPGNRAVLALATASRHPMVALTIAGTAFPGTPNVAAAVLLVLVVNTLVAIPYVARRKHDAVGQPPTGPSHDAPRPALRT
jgi:BASS family bile acid:Na+ symporter